MVPFPLVPATEKYHINEVPTLTVASDTAILASSTWKWELLRWCEHRVRRMPKAPEMNIWANKNKTK